MSVGVVVKPPDESFRRLETTPPDARPPLYAAVQTPILGGSCLTDAARGLDGPGVLSLILANFCATWFIPSIHSSERCT